MQSKTSFFNKGLFKKNISRTWIAGLLYFVLLLLIMPVDFIISTANHGDGDYYTDMGYTIDMRLFEHMSYMETTFIAIFVAVIVTGITFWYLFNRRDSYMMHSFPVSRRSMYFTGVLSSLTVSFSPVLLASILMTIAAVAKGAKGVSCIWYWALIVLVCTLLFTAIALFSFMCTGQLITGVVFYFIFNFLYLLMEVAFRLTATILMFGMSDAMSGINYNLLTPDLFIQTNVRIDPNIVMNDDYSKVLSFSPELVGAQYLGIYAVVAVVIIIFSYQLYRYKKLETVLDFISVPFMKPVFSVGMSFFISMVAGAFVAGMIEALTPLSYDRRYAVAIVSSMIIGAILYFATQMLIEKTLRVFCMKRAMHCVIYSVGALAVLLCMRLDVLGFENKVPKLSDIEWAGIQNDYTMVFTDEMEIEAFRQLHQNYLTDKSELRNLNIKYPDVEGAYFTIRYKLKNGNVVIRHYPVVDTESKAVSSEYVAAAQPILDFINNPGRIKQHIIGNIWKDCEIPEIYFSYIVADAGKDYYIANEEFEALTIGEKKEKNKKVYDALLKDIDAGVLFQQDFAGYKENDTKLIYNDMYFTVYKQGVKYFSDMNHFWDTNYEDTTGMQDISVDLNIDCKNTLKALKDEGFYNKDEEILTYKQFEEKYESGTGSYE